MTTKGPCRSLSFLEFLGFADVLQALETEGVLVVVDELEGLLVEALGMVAMHLGDVQSERAVGEDGDVGDALLVG